MQVTKKVRRFFIRILEDSEDEIDLEQIPYIPIGDIDPNAPATLEKIQNNELWHLTVGHNQLARAVNGLLVRVGRTEAKIGLVLAGVMFILGLAAKPYIEAGIDQLIQGFFK